MDIELCVIEMAGEKRGDALCASSAEMWDDEQEPGTFECVSHVGELLLRVRVFERGGQSGTVRLYIRACSSLHEI